MINSRKIAGRLAELGLTQKDVAAALGIAQATASQKINGIRPLYISEVEKMCALLKIDDAEIGAYFLSH